MISLEFFAVTGQLVAKHPVKVLKPEVTLNSGVTDGLYFQMHDSAIVAAEGAVPKKVWPAAECGFKDFTRNEFEFFLGLYVCLSSTKDTKTLATGGSDTMDILQIELVDPETPTGTSYVGNLTSPVSGLQVWSEAAGPKKLIALEVDGSDFTHDNFIQIFATDTVNPGDVPMTQFPIALNEVKTAGDALRFGEDGLWVRQVVGRVLKQGCTVKISSTSGYFTADDVALIKAEYK